MTNMLTHNLGYKQQYNRHLIMNNRLGVTNCKCELYCSENAILKEKLQERFK